MRKAGDTAKNNTFAPMRALRSGSPPAFRYRSPFWPGLVIAVKPSFRISRGYGASHNVPRQSSTGARSWRHLTRGLGCIAGLVPSSVQG